MSHGTPILYVQPFPSLVTAYGSKCKIATIGSIFFVECPESNKFKSEYKN